MNYILVNSDINNNISKYSSRIYSKYYNNGNDNDSSSYSFRNKYILYFKKGGLKLCGKQRNN